MTENNGGDPTNDSNVRTTAPGYRASKSVALQAEYRQIFESLNGDILGRTIAQNHLNNSSAIYHGEVVGMGFLPKLYDTAALQHFARIANTTYAILHKITERFIADPSYRTHFGFSPLLERLICLPTGYETTIPIARFDIFLNENTGTFKFCEFNTDGSSAMNEDRAICDALALSSTYQQFAEKHALIGEQVVAQELFDPWVTRFLQIYHTSAQAVPDPVVAIVDYQQNATLHEHLEFRRRFEQQGVVCLVVDMKDLELRDDALYARDIEASHPAHDVPVRIDAVYRRAVTHEILDELLTAPQSVTERLLDGESVAGFKRGAFALVHAVASGSVCMLGGFKTQVAHTKTVFCALHLPQTHTFLTAHENEFVKTCVPYTTWLTQEYIDLDEVKAAKDRWIIKPLDGYGTVGVYAGLGVSQQEWETLVDKHSDGTYVIQEYCTQFKTPNILPLPSGEQPAQTEPYSMLTGLFCYGGHLSGVYVRSGQHPLIAGTYGGITLGSLLVDYDKTAGLAIIPRKL